VHRRSQKRLLAALSLRCALEEQSPIVLGRSGSSSIGNHPPCARRRIEFAASFCRFWARTCRRLELISDRSQSLLQLWPLVYDIVSWPPKLVFGAEAFERFSTVRFPT
jgi:hypothetical protein